jgi:hypothetical protein
MKQLTLLSIVLCTFFFSYGQKKNYNSSTPQKAIESMNLISEGVPDYNAVSVFYCAHEAKTINAFDNAITEGRKVFSKFCNQMTTKFPKNVVAFDDTEIEIKPIDSLNKTISFSFSSTGIIEQLVKFKSGSVKYISEAVVDGEIQVKATVNGKEKKFNMKKENESYKITLPQKELDKLNDAIELIRVSVEKFNNFNSKIEKGEINSLNFSEVITRWYQDFVN